MIKCVVNELIIGVELPILKQQPDVEVRPRKLACGDQIVLKLALQQIKSRKPHEQIAAGEVEKMVVIEEGVPEVVVVRIDIVFEVAGRDNLRGESAAI
jgi:hypothetical protein